DDVSRALSHATHGAAHLCARKRISSWLIVLVRVPLLTRDSVLNVRVDGFVESNGQISDAIAGVLLGRVETDGVLHVLFALLGIVLGAELSIPGADVALGGDAAHELAHRLGRTPARIVADAFVHLLHAIALLVDLGHSG